MGIRDNTQRAADLDGDGPFGFFDWLLMRVWPGKCSTYTSVMCPTPTERCPGPDDESDDIVQIRV